MSATSKYALGGSKRLVLADPALFRRGLLMALGVAVVLGLYLGPWYNQKTGMRLSEDFFNSLSKGSTQFAAQMQQSATPYYGVVLNSAIPIADDQSEQLMTVLRQAGAEVTVAGERLEVRADLGALAAEAIADADLLLQNRSAALEEKYGLSARTAMYQWWTLFNSLSTEWLKQNEPERAAFASALLTKVIEPAYNYLGIEAQSVAERTGAVSLLLGLYVVYTLWWGFAIYYILRGLGVMA